MALTDTAVTTNQVSASSGVATSTTSFSPAAGTLVVVNASWLFGTNATGVSWTCQDSNSVSYSSAVQHQDWGGTGGSMIFWNVYNSAPGSITLKITCSNTGTADCQISPRMVTGQAGSPIGPNVISANSASGSNTTANTASLTTTQPGSQVYLAGNAAGAETAVAASNTTLISIWNDAGQGDTGMSGLGTSQTGTPGATTFGFTMGTSTAVCLVGIEVLPAVATPASAVPQPGSQLYRRFFYRSQVLTLGQALELAPGLASGTGAALAPGTELAAGLATGTGTAQSPQSSLVPPVTVATATGTALTVPLSLAGVYAPLQPGSQQFQNRRYRRQQWITLSTVISPALVASGFGTFSQVPANSLILSVIANITQNSSDTAIGAPYYQLWDGTTAQIGSAQPGTPGTTAHVDSVVFTGVTYSQLATLQLRIIADSAPGNTGATQSVDAVSLSVEWAPNQNATITPGVLVTKAVFPRAAVSTGVTVTPGVLAPVVSLPAATAGLLAVNISPAVLATKAVFPKEVTGVSVTITPGVLAAAVALPAITDVTAAGWATADSITGTGAGTWLNPGNVTGVPDGSNATWAPPF